MFRQLLNECRVDLKLSPEGPLLIKSGNNVGATTDAAFVKTFRNGRPEVYLPGSSLKGVLRSHTEKIGRTLNDQAICNPFNTLNHKPEKNPSPHGVGSCSDAFAPYKKQMSSPEVYKASCPVCRLFGSLSMAGRFNINDAYVAQDQKPPQPEFRDGVGIDRFSGGAVHGAKFDFEVITSGEFFTTIRITNFELWQLSLLSYLLRDLQDGMISLGMATSRGLGMVKGTVTSIQLDLITSSSPREIEGIGSLYQAQDKASYGFARENPLPFSIPFSRQGIRHRASISSDQQDAFYTSLQDYFPNFIQSFNSMQNWRKEKKLKIQ
ncbi:CRISPR-associated RAMP protein Csx7 [Deltaproteobacteria bacterium TL4]